MKDEIINGVQGLPTAAESNIKSSREKAQEAQEQQSTFATFALFGGHSVSVNPPDRLGATQARCGDLSRQSRCGEGRSGSVKLDSNRCRWSNHRQIVCKCFKMNGLQQIRCSGQSNPVKLNQTDCKGWMKVDPPLRLGKLRTSHRLDALA